MSSVLSIIGTVAFIIAGIAAVAGIYFWFSYKIPDVIDDLTGKSARKSIEALREQNEKSGIKAYRPSKTNSARGKLTEKIKSEKLGTKRKKRNKKSERKNTSSTDERLETGVLLENQVHSDFEAETNKLSYSESESLDETEVLTEQNIDYGGLPVQRRSKGLKLTMIDETMIIHSDEEI